MKNILYYVPGLGFGGAEKVNYQYIKNLSIDHNVTVYSESEIPSYIKDSLHGVSVVVIRKPIFHKISKLSLNFKNRFAKLFFYFCKVLLGKLSTIKLKNCSEFDIVIYGYHFLPKLPGFDGCNTKKVIIFHNSPESFFIGARSIFKKYFVNFYKKFSATVFLTQDSMLKYRELYGRLNNSIYVYNYISQEEVIKLSNEFDYEFNNNYIVSSGRLNEGNKDFETLIKAFKLSCDYHEYDLVIIGDGPSKAYLEKISSDCERIYFLGYLKNPYPVIKQSSAFILSSKSEGFGLVLVEAMILNIPVISSNVSGPKEILKNGELGYLFKPQDVEGLSEIIIDVCNDNFDKNYPTLAYKSLSRFSFQHTITKFKDYILND